jgi:hypothetical protein
MLRKKRDKQAEDALYSPEEWYFVASCFEACEEQYEMQYTSVKHM